MNEEATAINMVCALAEALAHQLDRPMLVADLTHIGSRHEQMGQEDAAKGLRLLVMATALSTRREK